jgi:uncharacterized membrane-anchored protein YitT (DUF2179 family)
MNEKRRNRSRMAVQFNGINIKQSFFIFLMILFFAIGNILFAVPNQIMNGGMTGLSLMGYYLYEFNIGLGIFLLNTPLFIIAFLFYKELFFKSAVSMLTVSLLIGFLQEPLLSFGIQNVWIGSIVGGLWMGVALGILSKMNASLGGGSLLGKMLHERYGVSLTKAIFLIDASVYPLSLFLIGFTETIFSLVLTLFSALGIYLVTKTRHEAINAESI